MFNLNFITMKKGALKNFELSTKMVLSNKQLKTISGGTGPRNPNSGLQTGLYVSISNL